EGDRRAHGDVFEKLLRHETGHADAAVRSGIAGEESLVHADASRDAHEEGHLCAIEDRPWGPFVLRGIDILFDDPAGGVHIVPVEARLVVAVLLLDAETSGLRVKTFAATGDDRDANQFATLVEVGALFA